MPESADAVQPSRGWAWRFYESVWWALLAGPIGIGVAALFQSRWLVAALPVVLMFPGYGYGLSRGSAPRVFLLSLIWAATLSASVIAWTIISPESAGASILNGIPYRDEMFVWIRTGMGPEGDPAQFLPSHLGHLLLFAAASLVSGGFLGLLMGSVLMSYMSFYVGSVALASVNPALGILVGWHPWSILRVVGFVAIGVSLSLPLLRRRPAGFHHKLMVMGLGLVIIDAIVKALLAEPWRQLLGSILTP